MPFVFEREQVRAILDDHGAPWFVAADIARALEYRMASDMTRNLPEDEKGTHEVSTLGGSQQMNVISEPGLYRAVFLARTERAEPFRHWVTHEVLPSIRRTGSYAAPSSTLPQSYAEALYLAGQQAERIRALEAQLVPQAPAAPRAPKGTRLPRAEHYWASRVRAWLEAHPEAREFTTGQVLAGALQLPEPSNAQRHAVGACMRSLGWKRGRRRTATSLHWVFTRPEAP